MIINIRGTNGSGKSTIARNFLERFEPKLCYGICGPRRPEAYEVVVHKSKMPLYLLGPYESPTGGADAITGKGFDILIELADRYRERGNVLFEGVAISNSYGQVGEWLLKHKNKAIVAFMDTPLDICLHGLGLRQKASGNAAGTKHVADKYAAVQRVKQRMANEGIRVEDISRKNGTDKILSWLT